MHGAAAPVTLPVSTVTSKQRPDVTVVRMHNVPGGINVLGLFFLFFFFVGGKDIHYTKHR